MFKWNKVPFIRFLLPFAFGIASAIWLKTALPVSFLSCVFVFILILFALIFSNYIIKRKNDWIVGLILNVLLFISAYQLTIIANSTRNAPNYYGNIPSDSDLYLVKIIEPISVKQNSTKAIVKVEASNIKGVWESSNGKGIIYIEKDSLSDILNYGDQLLIYSQFIAVKPPLNPNEFDYRSFLANKYIYYQSYIKKTQWKRVAENKGNFIFHSASKFRKHLLKIFEDNNMTGREYGVIAAILLGQTDHIDSELFREYQGSGAVHVLVVAGLHVGIILLMLNFLLGFLDNYKYGKHFKIVLILSFIWFYAIMTGLSSPVLRAATMITFVSIGRMNRRHFNSLNLLSLSAIIFLVFNPNLLIDLGFQLSYLAVTGILLLQKPIASLWKPTNFLINKLWQITALSFAAQLFTLPLTLYYFHQFPNLFLITNIIVFFFVAAIIFTGIAVLITSWFSFISVLITKLLVWLLFGLNTSIHFIETLPIAVTRSISFTGFSCVLLYLFVMFLLFYILMKMKKMLLPALIILICFISFSSFKTYQQYSQKKFIVYDINKLTAINIIDGKHCLVIADSIVITDKEKFNFQFENNYSQLGIQTYSKEFINYKKNVSKYTPVKIDCFFQIKDIRMVLINKPIINNYSGNRIKVDYLIISHNAKVKISELTKMFDAGIYIFDSSNYLTQSLKWSKECDSIKVNYYNVLDKGAFEKDL
ncbi:MAG: ComEC/Rec2 family competence protein [Bacteroidota bacterium]